jgi:hypothetical protein
VENTALYSLFTPEKIVNCGFLHEQEVLNFRIAYNKNKNKSFFNLTRAAFYFFPCIEYDE